jgi:hypothetical protein
VSGNGQPGRGQPARPAWLPSLRFFSLLRWIDGRPLLDVIEDYRMKLFTRFLDEKDERGWPRYNLLLAGRSKKNAKSLDLCLGSLFALLGNDPPGGWSNECYLLASDEGQAADDLSLVKRLIGASPVLAERLTVGKKVVERDDGRGFLAILPAQDVEGAHGKTYRFCGFDEIHTYRTWDLLEALQLDPTRPEAQQWITSYASLHHKPGVPLFDLMQAGRAGRDPRMLFSWYAADYTTDPEAAALDPEARANPSRGAWADAGYLEQQRRRLPSHKFRRLHLNLPGLPEGSAYQPEPVMDAVARGTVGRPPEPGVKYAAFVDMSFGSVDDAVLAIGHKDRDGRAVVDTLVNQGPAAPFDPLLPVKKFSDILSLYGVSRVWGDRLGGETFRTAFREHGVEYLAAEKTTSELYEALEPRLNGRQVVLVDQPLLEQQLLGLIWRGGKIDHVGGEHDDWACAAAGVVEVVLRGAVEPVGMPLAAGVRESPWAMGGVGRGNPFERWRLDAARPDRGWPA